MINVNLTSAESQEPRRDFNKKNADYFIFGKVTRKQWLNLVANVNCKHESNNLLYHDINKNGTEDINMITPTTDVYLQRASIDIIVASFSKYCLKLNEPGVITYTRRQTSCYVDKGKYKDIDPTTHLDKQETITGHRASLEKNYYSKKLILELCPMMVLIDGKKYLAHFNPKSKRNILTRKDHNGHTMSLLRSATLEYEQIMANNPQNALRWDWDLQRFCKGLWQLISQALRNHATGRAYDEIKLRDKINKLAYEKSIKQITCSQLRQLFSKYMAKLTTKLGCAVYNKVLSGALKGAGKPICSRRVVIKDKNDKLNYRPGLVNAVWFTLWRIRGNRINQLTNPIGREKAKKKEQSVNFRQVKSLIHKIIAVIIMEGSARNQADPRELDALIYRVENILTQMHVIFKDDSPLGDMHRLYRGKVNKLKDGTWIYYRKGAKKESKKANQNSYEQLGSAYKQKLERKFYNSPGVIVVNRSINNNTINNPHVMPYKSYEQSKMLTHSAKYRSKYAKSKPMTMWDEVEEDKKRIAEERKGRPQRGIVPIATLVGEFLTGLIRNKGDPP